MSVGKEIRDQSLHALWEAANVVLLFLAWRLLPVAWEWSVALTALSAVSHAGLVFREWWQKHDKPGGIWANWPWMDTMGYVLGVAAGVAAGVVMI